MRDALSMIAYLSSLHIKTSAMHCVTVQPIPKVRRPSNKSDKAYHEIAVNRQGTRFGACTSLLNTACPVHARDGCAGIGTDVPLCCRTIRMLSVSAYVIQSKILPRLRIPAGSSARLMARCISSTCGGVPAPIRRA